MPRYITAKCPKCPNTVIVEEVLDNPRVQVWMHPEIQYPALCSRCGHEWTATGLNVKLTETKKAIPKPTQH